jgi:type IV fimbrial biogenesis protein FimT
MLSSATPSRGVTLIELMVTMAVFAAMLALAAPSIGGWIQNGRIRTGSESILNGLQLAKAEAVSRNARVRFQLTSTATNACTVSTTGRNWVVNIDQAVSADTAVEGHCGDPPDDTVPPQILQIRPASDGSTGAEVLGSQASVVFNGLGRPVPAMGGDITFDVSNPSAGSCAANGGDMACLRIIVTSQGLLRMCNPHLTATQPNDPRAC